MAIEPYHSTRFDTNITVMSLPVPYEKILIATCSP